MNQPLQHNTVTPDEWRQARLAHLKNEKALTRFRDMVARERRELPWLKMEKDYVFDTNDGQKTLSDLFGDNSQLIIHHFMLGPDWEAGCPSCSMEADHAEGALVHLVNHDVSYVRVSRAPLEQINAYNHRMGWTAPWVSAFNNEFNFDFQVSFTPEALKQGINYNYQTITDPKYLFDELPGLSVFYKNEQKEVFHTYSSYARGNEEVIGAFVYLDITPKGRNETEIMDWVKRHDEYDTATANKPCHSA